MSTEAQAKKAIEQIDRAMRLLDGQCFDTAWYLLSMAKLALLEVASPVEQRRVDDLTSLISMADLDDATTLPKKH